MLKKFYLNTFVLGLMGLAISCSSSKNSGESVVTPDEEVVELINENLQDAAAQYKVLMSRLPEGRFPKTYHKSEDRLETSGSEWWVSGFYPGTLLYLYETTGDEALYKEAVRILGLLEKEKYNTSTHDLGFMMYCSFGNAKRIVPKEEYDEILLTSAKSLASRFNPEVGAILSWGEIGGEDYLVIIDNMMNLELLFWATRHTGDSTYYNIAVTHANTTIENHFRPDYSSYHVLNYDPASGETKEKKTAQGYSDESAWARGQAWGLYGFTATYRDTKEEKYLQQAKNIADFILNHPNLPEDMIPYWDFNAPNIPDALRDASAAAIMASAFLELSNYVDRDAASRYFEAAETIIKKLSTATYKAEAGENGGFILQHGVGHFPAQSEVDVPLTYADYYYVEAMKRYKEMGEGGE